MAGLLILKHQTAAEFIARFREAYRNAFGLTVTQWNNLKTKMQTLVANYNAVQSAQGE